MNLSKMIGPRQGFVFMAHLIAGVNWYEALVFGVCADSKSVCAYLCCVSGDFTLG